MADCLLFSVAGEESVAADEAEGAEGAVGRVPLIDVATGDCWVSRRCCKGRDRKALVAFVGLIITSSTTSRFRLLLGRFRTITFRLR
jgi:hypothetical protein